MEKIRWGMLLVVALIALLAASCLLPASASAQRDRVALGERLGAQVIRAGEKPQSAESRAQGAGSQQGIEVQKGRSDSLQPRETLQPEKKEKTR